MGSMHAQIRAHPVCLHGLHHPGILLVLVLVKVIFRTVAFAYSPHWESFFFLCLACDLTFLLRKQFLREAFLISL